MHKTIVSDLMPQVIDNSFILVALVPSIFLMKEKFVGSFCFHPVNLVTKEENLYIWLRQVVVLVRMFEPVVCESLIQFYFPWFVFGSQDFKRI